MSLDFIGEVRLFAGGTPPHGWALCNGQILPIASNTALFSLLGTRYGGNGTSTFALPNFQGRIPIHPGQGPGLSNRSLAEQGGSESHPLTQAELPLHTHTMGASTANGLSDSPAGRVLARNPAGVPIYAASADSNLAPSAAGSSGGDQPHNNMAPYLGVSFIIALQGVFPQRP
jgi:microcystin-dependent protein